MPSAAARRPTSGQPPTKFRVHRELPVGRHPLLSAFPGLDRLDTARRQVPNAAHRKRLFTTTFVELVAEDLWMYVAPWEKIGRYRQWSPVVTPNLDCIVVGESHLRESPELTLFLDIFHELCHILQRHEGADLFDGTVSYVRRKTEVDAYRFVVDEAHALGVDDSVLRDYLRVEWITEKELQQLLRSVGVAAR